ncbi:MAG: TIGR03943 family protein [Chloroflexi bacterium]|nr:TIGR03943 family protein [Chloroflexota bacterium]
MTTAAPHKREEQVDRIAWAKSLILFGMGIYLTLLILTGNLDNYINQRFAWLAGVGALLFFALGLTTLYRSLNPKRHEHEHHHYHISWDIILVVAFPLLLAILIPSRSLGIEAVNGGVSLNPVGVANLARSPLDRNILDWLREFDRASTPAQFNGTSVDVVGFVYREPIHPQDGFMLARFTMSCCVADAFPIGMPIIAAGAEEYAAGDWLRVKGQLKASAFGGDFLPVVFADAIKVVDEPRQPYLYP